MVVHRAARGAAQLRLQGGQLRLADGLDALEASQQLPLAHLADVGDTVERGGDGRARVALVVVGDGEAVRFLLNLPDEGKNGGVGVQVDLMALGGGEGACTVASSLTMPKMGMCSPNAAQTFSATAACVMPPSMRNTSGSGANFSSPSA